MKKKWIKIILLSTFFLVFVMQLGHVLFGDLNPSGTLHMIGFKLKKYKY